MEELEYLESTLKSLRKPMHRKKLLHALMIIRKQVNNPIRQNTIQLIKESNCLKQMVKIIQSETNVQIIDLVLSILGNCCTNHSVTQITITECNIVYHLNLILEKHKKDSIQGRAFRILGNICDGWEPIRIIRNDSNIVTNTLQFIKNFCIDGVLQTQDLSKPEVTNISNASLDMSTNISECTSIATITMALRFIRKLIKQNTFNLLTTSHNLLNSIGIILIKCANHFEGNRNYQIVLNDVLKIIQIISSSAYISYDVITELRNTEMGDSLESFGQIIALQPDKIVKIVMKMAQYIRHDSDLPFEEIVTKLIDSIKIDRITTNLTLSKHKLHLQCINRLMDQPSFHEKLKPDHIRELIKLLEKMNSIEDSTLQCCIYICSILNKCRYNESLMKVHLSYDIIRIIINKLEIVSGKMAESICDVAHDKKNSKYGVSKNLFKRFKKSPRKDDCRNNSIFFEVKQSLERCASPSSCSDISSCGPFSPTTSTGFHCEDSDSDNYSPLCSDNEFDDEPDFKISPDYERPVSDVEEQRPAYNSDQLDLKFLLIKDINSLLKCYCNMRPIDQQLGNPKLITILMNIVFQSAISNTNCESTVSVVLQIAQTREFLIPLMKAGVVQAIYEVMDIPHYSCAICETLYGRADDIITKFWTVAQTDSIKGDIAHALFKNGTAVCRDGINNHDTTPSGGGATEQLVLAIPYIIRNSSILSKLMLDCGGLSILIKLLRNRNDIKKQKQSIHSLCTLATDNLRIKSPVASKKSKYLSKFRKTCSTNDSNKLISRLRVGLYTMPATCMNVVTFRLDDHSEIKADRTSLSQKSDYFNALLYSKCFKESGEDLIELRNVALVPFNCLLSLLDLNVNLTHTLDFDYGIDIILEVIVLADRFLLNELSYILVCHVEQLLTPQTAPVCYKWALESGTNILRVESIAFALAGDVSFKERLEMFNVLFNLGYFVELVDDVEKLIMQFL